MHVSMTLSALMVSCLPCMVLYAPLSVKIIQVCVGFVATNEYYPLGCCYLKTALKAENALTPFTNNIGGQVYKKSFTGTGAEPARTGYQLLGLLGSPGNDLSLSCWQTLDSCFQLCESNGIVSC